MHRSHHKWFSSILNRDMEMLIFGHAGAPMIVFPTSQGRYFEYEDRGMVGALSDGLERGLLQLVCVDSVDAESWYCSWAQPSGRIARHIQYDQYVLNEVVPFVRQDNRNDFWMTTGCSFGAYHAINFGLRHPEVIRRSIGLSGLYDMRSFMDGYYNQDFYFNNPIDYTANLHDANYIQQLQRQDIILAIGGEDQARWSNDKLAANLWRAGIGNALRIWDGWAHDWPFWDKMIRIYINGHD
jgi:esterase/lipase superfamily enzyme